MMLDYIILRSLYDKNGECIFTYVMPYDKQYSKISDCFIPRFTPGFNGMLYRDDNRAWIGNMYSEIVEYIPALFCYEIKVHIVRK